MSGPQTRVAMFFSAVFIIFGRAKSFWASGGLPRGAPGAFPTLLLRGSPLGVSWACLACLKTSSSPRFSPRRPPKTSGFSTFFIVFPRLPMCSKPKRPRTLGRAITRRRTPSWTPSPYTGRPKACRGSPCSGAPGPRWAWRRAAAWAAAASGHRRSRRRTPCRRWAPCSRKARPRRF